MKEAGFILSIVRRFLFGGRESSRGRSRLRRVRGGVLGIAFSLIPLVVVFVVANGMISGITMRFIETGTYHLQLVARGRENGESKSAVIQDLLRLDDVLHAFPEVQGLGLLAGKRGHNGVQIRGVDPEIYERDANFARYLDIIEGDFDLSGERNVLVGENLASLLEVTIGDEVRLVTAQTQRSERIIPRVSRFTVTGIVSSGYRELDALWVFMREDDARRIIPPNEAREFIGIKVANPFLLDSEVQELQFIQSDQKGGEYNSLINEIRSIAENEWRLLTWFNLEQSQYMSFITTRNLLLFIMVLIVLVAAVNISSAMIMLILEKQEEIAILKAMGIRNRQVLAVFLICGGITGGLGTIMGLSLGALAAYNVNGIIAALEFIVNAFGYLRTSVITPGELYIPIELFNPDFYLNKIPVHLRFSDLGIMALITLLLSVIMSYLPARRAVRLHPLALLHRH